MHRDVMVSHSLSLLGVHYSLFSALCHDADEDFILQYSLLA